MRSADPVRTLEVRGDRRAMGLAHGGALREQIHRCIDIHRAVFAMPDEVVGALAYRHPPVAWRARSLLDLWDRSEESDDADELVVGSESYEVGAGDGDGSVGGGERPFITGRTVVFVDAARAGEGVVRELTLHGEEQVSEAIVATGVEWRVSEVCVGGERVSDEPASPIRVRFSVRVEIAVDDGGGVVHEGSFELCHPVVPGGPCITVTIRAAGWLLPVG